MKQEKNPLLQQTEDAVMAQIKPELKLPLERTVTAGLQVMYGSKSNIMTKQLGKSENYAHNVGEGAAKLLGILYQQSKKTMPMDVGVPAATVFMLEGLDFLEKAGKVQVTPDLLAQATQDMGAAVLQLFGVSREKIQEMMAQQGQGGPPTDPGTPGAPPPPPTQPGVINAAQGA